MLLLAASAGGDELSRFLKLDFGRYFRKDESIDNQGRWRCVGNFVALLIDHEDSEELYKTYKFSQ